MDQFNFGRSIQPPSQSLPDFNQRQIPTRLHSDPRVEAEPNECNVARKVQKADREKLRRDRLNEQFTELGNTLDPDRPKNDKASILGDTIQVLRDLTTQVDRLKAEYATLTEESRELSQEKNDLKEEKASLKSDIDNLNLQYQQRIRAMYPWGGMDPSVVMHPPPPYPYPVPMPIAPGPIPMHPSLQPYHFFGNQNPALVPNPCSTFMPYMTPNTIIEQHSHNVTPIVPASSRTRVSSKQDSRQRSSDHGESKTIEESDDVATELELKTPGSTADQDSSSRQKKPKKYARKDSIMSDGNSSSRCSSSHSVLVSSSDSVVGVGPGADDTERELPK
nr:bHLH9 [Bupleurum chinense]